MHRIITMHARPRQTDRQAYEQTDHRQTNGRTDEHHGNSATIRSMNGSRAKNLLCFFLGIGDLRPIFPCAYGQSGR